MKKKLIINPKSTKRFILSSKKKPTLKNNSSYNVAKPYTIMMDDTEKELRKIYGDYPNYTIVYEDGTEKIMSHDEMEKELRKIYENDLRSMVYPVWKKIFSGVA